MRGVHYEYDTKLMPGFDWFIYGDCQHWFSPQENQFPSRQSERHLAKSKASGSLLSNLSCPSLSESSFFFFFFLLFVSFFFHPRETEWFSNPNPDSSVFLIRQHAATSAPRRLFWVERC